MSTQTGLNRVASVHPNIRDVTSDYEVIPEDDVLSCDTTGGSLVIRLPVFPADGDKYWVKDGSGSASVGNPIIVSGNGHPIDAGGTFPITNPYDSIGVTFDHQRQRWLSDNKTVAVGMVTADQGLPNTIPNSWPVEITDGTFVLGTPLHPLIVDVTDRPARQVGHVTVDNFPAVGPVDQGLPNTLANGWPTKLTDGTSVLGILATPLRVDPTGTTTQPVSFAGPITNDQGAPNTLPNGWPVKITDGASVLGTGAAPVRTDPTGTTTQPVSGTVAVSNFPAMQPVSGTVTANQGTPQAIVAPWPVELSDGAAQVGTIANPLRTDPTGTTPQPVSGTVTGNQGTPRVITSPWPVELSDGTAQTGTLGNPLRVDPTGTTPQPVTPGITADRVVTGTITAIDQAVEIDCSGIAVVGIELAGTWIGSIAYEYTTAPSPQAPTDWHVSETWPVEVGTLRTVVSTNLQSRQPVSGLTKIRLHATAWTSGTANVTLRGNVTAGFARVLAEIADGTNGGLARVEASINADGLAGGSDALLVTSVGKLFNGLTYDRMRDTSKTGALDVAEQFMPVAEDNTNGVIEVVNKPLAVATYTPAVGQDFATVSKTAKASTGNWRSFRANSRALTLTYFQLHDKATVPTLGNVPKFEIAVNGAVAGSVTTVVGGEDFFSENGANFAIGLSYGYSTTSGTYTAATAANHDTSYTYL